MKVFLLAGAMAAALVGCASAPTAIGGGEARAVYPTAMYSPLQINPTEATQEKYIKSWVKKAGSGFGDFKKITIPAYTVEFVTFVNDVNQNKLATAQAKDDSAKNILDMSVTLPHDQHADLMQEIADESHARLVEKLKQAGFEVVEWHHIKNKSEEARDFEKNKMNTMPIVHGKKSVSVAAKGLGRLDTIFWGASAGSAARDAGATIIVPHFTIGYGYFGGDLMPHTIKETYGSTSLAFTPQLQVYSGSGIKTFGKYAGGHLSLKNTAVSHYPFVKGMKKTDDIRDSAKNDGDKAKPVHAGLHYHLAIDPAKFKEAVHTQISMVEDMIVTRYKNEL